MGASLKFFRHDHARVEYLNFSVRIFWKSDMIEQLQMGVSTIATALVHTAL